MLEDCVNPQVYYKKKYNIGLWGMEISNCVTIIPIWIEWEWMNGDLVDKEDPEKVRMWASWGDNYDLLMLGMENAFLAGEKQGENILRFHNMMPGSSFRDGSWGGAES